MTDHVTFPNFPYWQDGGWHVGALPVAAWGSAYTEAVRLPVRWQHGPDGVGQVEPSDFEMECFLHLCEHEIARANGAELSVAAECMGLDDPLPIEAYSAAERGLSLIAFCPGLSWFWDGENRPADLAAKFDRLRR